MPWRVTLEVLRNVHAATFKFRNRVVCLFRKSTFINEATNYKRLRGPLGGYFWRLSKVKSSTVLVTFQFNSVFACQTFDEYIQAVM